MRPTTPARSVAHHRRATHCLAAAALLLLAATVPSARADGAFPDAQQILLPPDRPHELALVTTFGLLFSHDDGSTWQLVCEEAITPFPSLFQLTAPPVNAILAKAPAGLIRSGDDGCSWGLASGLDGSVVQDDFADPIDPQHAFVLAGPAVDPKLVQIGLYESRDGGKSFGKAIYTSQPGTFLTGVENARSAPRTVYLTANGANGNTPILSVLRSDDGGAHFTSFDWSAQLPDGLSIRIAAVDPVDEKTIYLRVLENGVDSLAISHDGGATLARRIALPWRMSSFLRRADGTLLLSKAVASSTDTGEVRASTDGGQTFLAWSRSPHVKFLAERGGALYVAADPLTDGYALAVSTDGGASFSPLLRYFDFCGVRTACPGVASTCAAPLSMLHFVPSPSCLPDGGAPSTLDAGNPPASPAGCKCGLGRRGSPSDSGLLVGALIALRVAARRRRAGR